MNQRNAGILLHITSLPSPFGIGDMGPEAYRFADFLRRCKQTYWQLLPLTPIEKGQGYSPYSSTSSMAGNTLLISPELLRDWKLLSDNDVRENTILNNGKVKFEEVQLLKEKWFANAFAKFQESNFKEFQQRYKKFIKKEAAWLNDYALYTVLKETHDGKPWYEWPSDFKYRETSKLRKFTFSNRKQIEKVKWLQFIFFEQWMMLKRYCQQRDVQFFGDLPFYVSYDSCDVWATPQIFALDKNKSIQGIAGVPPDYFNADGQLWGMPVFKWDVLKKTKFSWWIQRLKKNVELFDIVRLDHFRAFADYWEVPSGETTAKNGKWKPGPGAAIFKTVRQELGKLPFVAEDLGDINEAVYQLRDQFQFPGMKVLQFAFGDNPGKNDYAPHNYTPNFIVYTGTHDNNTTVGWFKNDTSEDVKGHLNKYIGRSLDESNIHVELARLAYSSIAKTVIIPMQDVLGLDQGARINTPASTEKNWDWRLKRAQLKDNAVETRLIEWAAYYNRG